MATRRKPKAPTRRALAYGEPWEDTDLNDQWIERGNIIAVNPTTCTCDVETETRGRFNAVPFPYLVQDPEGCGGRVYVPRVGQQVVVQQGIGAPFITLGLPTSTDVNADVGAAADFSKAATYSKGALSFSPSAPASYAARLPRSLLPGDWMWLGNQGQHIALLDGGVAAMLASPWSQVSCSQEDDTTTVVGRNLNIVTGFGNLRFFDDSGKSGMVFEGGTDQTLESGYGRDNWTVQAKIGGDAEGLVDFRINNRDGEAVAKTVWKADGSVINMTSGDQEQKYNGNMGLTYNGNFYRDVGGVDLLSVGLDREENFFGSQTTAVSQNRSCNVLNDRADIISRDWNMSAGRVHSLKVSGNPTAIPPNSSVAAPWSISNGSWIVDVGFPGPDLGLSESHIEFNTYSPKGKIQLSSLLDKISLDTYMPDSVLLGSMMGVAVHHAVNWEPLEILLKQFITWAQNHIHPTGVGPSGPAVVPFPAQAILEPLLVPCKNLKVMMGI
jgi:hypothetical protein